MQRLSDEVNRAFDYDNCSQLPSLDAVRVDVLVQAFQQRFNHLQSVLPEKAFQNCKLAQNLSFHLANKVSVVEIVLLQAAHLHQRNRLPCVTTIRRRVDGVGSVESPILVLLS